MEKLLNNLITSSKRLNSYEQIMKMAGNVTDKDGFKMSQNIHAVELQIKRVKKEILAITKE